MSAMFFGNAVVGLQLGRFTSLLGGATGTILCGLCAMTAGYVAMAAAFEPVASLGAQTAGDGVWVYAT
jgi:hypothetical protein